MELLKFADNSKINKIIICIVGAQFSSYLPKWVFVKSSISPSIMGSFVGSGLLSIPTQSSVPINPIWGYFLQDLLSSAPLYQLVSIERTINISIFQSLIGSKQEPATMYLTQVTTTVTPRLNTYAFR